MSMKDAEKGHKVGIRSCCAHTLSDEDVKFLKWQKKYRAVEAAILAERERMAESKRRSRMRKNRALGDLCEMTDGLAAFCKRTGMTLDEAAASLQSRRHPHPSLVLAYELGGLAWFAVAALRKELTHRMARADHEAKRPFYYARERERRRMLAEERRKVRMRHTTNPCPTKEEVLEAWTHVKDSPEALLRFGSLMEDLECYVDNSLRRTDDGVIVGRRPGIKGWLQMELPALHMKYTTVMAYKAAAKRMRQIIGIRDPIPLSAALPAWTDRKERTSAENAESCREAGSQDYGAEKI